jgi:hypothetical protein
MGQTASVVVWTGFLATDPKVPGSIPGANIFWEVGDLELGSLILVRITDVLTECTVAAPV